MVISAKGFTYDGKSSDDFGLIICEFSNSGSSDSSGGQIEFAKISTPIQNRWYKTGNANYSEALQFEFEVAKSNFEKIDTYEYSAISRWLVKKDDYKDFMIIRTDYDNIHFYAQMNTSPIEISGSIYGIKITGICDSPFGYNQLIEKEFVGCGEYIIIDTSDEIGYIYPDIEINVNSACDIKIINETDKREFFIKDCVPNEVITINGRYLTISTTALLHNIHDCINYKFPRIVNDYNKRKNIFKIEGDCTVKMQYRPIRKVVI